MKKYTQEEIKSITKIISNSPDNLRKGCAQAAKQHGRTTATIVTLYYNKIKPNTNLFSLSSADGKKTLSNTKNIKVTKSAPATLDAKFRLILNKLDKKTLVDIIMQEN